MFLLKFYTKYKNSYKKKFHTKKIFLLKIILCEISFLDRDLNLIEKWIKLTETKDWFPMKYYFLIIYLLFYIISCLIHFNEARFVDGKKRRLLTKATMCRSIQ